MPLRDHFHPPVSRRASWEGFHGLWPAVIVQQLSPRLPEGFVAEPRVHLGSFYEIDVCTYDQIEAREPDTGSPWQPSTTAATVLQASPAPTLSVDAEFPDRYGYEVLVFDLERDRRLVAAVEIVSPANKDRPESRR